MTTANEIDGLLCQEPVADEFCRLASSSPPGDSAVPLVLLSGLVPTHSQDGVMCPLMVRRHLMVPAIGFDGVRDTTRAL